MSKYLFSVEYVLVDLTSAYLFAKLLSTSLPPPRYKTETALEGDLRMFAPIE